MSVDLDRVKEANPIEEIISKEYTLRGRGRWLRAVEHDSLVVDTYNQAYYWNSRNEQGDVITWVMKRHRTDFKGAVEWLCRRAGLPEPQWRKEDAQAAQVRRRRYEALTVAARHFVRCLRENQAALDYCIQRGWTEETIRKAGLGYTDGNRKDLVGEFSMHEISIEEPGARAALGIPAGMVVYPHVEAGRVTYLSARSIEGKRHYNLPTDLVGPRRRYTNFEYSPLAEEVVVVEGQADAVTLAQWGIPAIALAGTAIDESLLRMLARHQTIYVALDNDEGGRRATEQLASALGPTARIVTWPEKDANEWLLAGATADDCRALLATAPVWVEMVASQAGKAEGTERERLLRETFALVARMEDFQVASYRQQLAKAMRINLRQFNAMLKAVRKEVPEEEQGEALITIETIGGLIADHLVELIYQPPNGSGAGTGNGRGGKTLFAVRRPDGSIGVVPHLDMDGIRYIPLPPHSRVLVERVVHFPTDLGELKSTRELIRLIQRTIHKYVDVDVFYETLSAYYVLFTWLYDCFNTLPYLRALGDAGTGKSRLIQVVGALCYRPIFVTGAATVSPVFRLLDRFRGTLILDEADFRASDEAADYIKILNTGYQRTQGVVLRAGDRNSGFEPEVYVVYGPKVIATRRKFQDWALESRCLTKEMGGPTTRDDIPIDLPRSFWTEEAPAIRNLLLRYRLEHWRPEIELDYAGMDPSIEPRLNQVTVALATIVDDEDLKHDLRNFIREYNRQLIAERGMTLASKVLEVIAVQEQLAKDSGESPDFSLKTIAHKVNLLIDYENYDEGGGSDKRVTPKKIGSVIRNQLHLRTQRSSTRHRGYEVVYDPKRIEALRKRFGIDDGVLVDTMQVLFDIEARIQMQEQQDEVF